MTKEQIVFELIKGLRVANLDYSTCNSIHDHIDKIEQSNLATLFSKLLRSVEVSPKSVIRRLSAGNVDKSKIPFVYLSLLQFFLIIFKKTDDLRYLNSCNKLIDSVALSNNLLVWLSIKFKHREWFNKLKIDCQSSIDNFDFSKSKRTVICADRFIDSEELEYLSRNISHLKCSASVVLFSPNPKSLYTLCVAEMLANSGIRVCGIVVKNVFSLKRLIEEIKRDGFLWVSKKFLQRYLFPRYSERIVGDKSLFALSERIGLLDFNVDEWAIRHHSKVLYVDDFNTTYVQGWIRNLNVDAGVFTGGGMIRKNILCSFPVGVFNCHGGVLPAYRGLDVEKWAFLEGNSDLVGCCVHLMSEEVDQGPILYQYKICNEDINIKTAGFKLEFPQCVLLSSSVIRYFSKSIHPLSQYEDDGRQFFYMHKNIYNALQNTVYKPS